MTSRISSSRFLESVDEATMASRRRIGSAMSVARLQSIAVTWLFISALPAFRSETGTAAISGPLGSAFRSSR